jgi:hypothetical protein
MVDRWTDQFFWPALIGAWVAAIAAAASALVGEPITGIVTPLTIVLALLATCMFAFALLDQPTRRAVEKFNRTSDTRWREMSWGQRLFAKEYGDRRLLIVNRLVWVEGSIFVIAGMQELALLGFISFALSTLMLMLLMKRMPASDPPKTR